MAGAMTTLDARLHGRAHSRLTAPALLLALAALVLPPAPARAEVERLEVLRREPVAEGRPFGLAGPYEKLAGRVHFALDPEHPANGRIVDLERAPRDDDGRVRFAADFYLLRPAQPGRGNGALFVEVPNRGGKAIVRYFDQGAERTLDPTTAADFGDGFLLRQGFTLAWVGWQLDVPREEGLMRLEAVPVRGKPQKGVEGLVRADHVFSQPSRLFPLGHRDHRPYPVADREDPRNVLTVRDSRLGERRPISRQEWIFNQVAQEIRLLTGDFEPGKIYEAVYVSRRPVVVGLGLAAVRDFASYLRHGEDSPVAVDRVLGMGISQTGRFLRHFLYQGFNRDPAGRPAFDGLLIHTAGAGRGSFNHRFAQPSRDAHPFSAFFYPTDLFPFTGGVQTDPVTSRKDGLFASLEGSGDLPKVFFTNTGYEYWGRAAALTHLRLDGEADFPPSPNARLYHLAGTQHFVGPFPPEPAGTRHPANPADFLPVLRALLLALDGWVAHGTEPPPSRIPTLADATLVAPAELAFPALSTVAVPRQPHQAYRMEYGPRFLDQGIIDQQPPEVGEPFPALVPQVDADGNELGGLRLPEIAVPLATYTPWNWRAPETGAPTELADFRGSFLPFAATPEDRRLTSDPRPSVAERYHSREEYLGRYTQAALALVEERYLLARDLPYLLERAQRLWELVTGE